MDDFQKLLTYLREANGTMEMEYEEFRRRLHVFLDESEKLMRWKQEQLAVTPDWQEIGREMGLQIGESVHDKILPWMRDMKSQLEWHELFG